jgi:hypothetical protein
MRVRGLRSRKNKRVWLPMSGKEWRILGRSEMKYRRERRSVASLNGFESRAGVDSGYHSRASIARQHGSECKIDDARFAPWFVELVRYRSWVG